MQDKLLYEYAVVRLVPRVEREEFINIGVILFCKKADYLQTKIAMDPFRARALFPELEIEDIQCYLTAFQKIVNASPGSGPIAEYDVPSRFRWLTAKRSTVVQTSPIHSGFSSDLNKTLSQLFDELV